MSDVGGHASAFADDVGLALPDVIRGLRQLVVLLDQVGSASGLHLNWTKTVLLNFSKFSDFQVRRKLEESVPRASGILIQSSGKYLGYLVGPSAATKVWDKPSSKFFRRVRHVRGLGLSLLETSIAFGIFAFSVLRFTLQLVSVSTTLTSMYGIALDIVTGTPRYAYGASILCHLQTLGFPPNSDFPSLPLVSRASAYRTAIRSMSFRPCVAWWKLLGNLMRLTFFLVFVIGLGRTLSLTWLRSRGRWRPFLVFRGTRASGITRASSSGS